MIPGHDLLQQLNNAQDQQTRTISYEAFLDIIHSDLVQNVQNKGQENFNAASNPNLKSKSFELKQLLRPEVCDVKSCETSLKDLEDLDDVPKLGKVVSGFNGLTDPKLALCRTTSDQI